MILTTLFSKFSLNITGLPHPQEIQGNSRNFQIVENLKETQKNSGNFDF